MLVLEPRNRGARGRRERTLLESLDVAGGQGDADAVDLGTLPELALLRFVVRHLGCERTKRLLGISTVEAVRVVS